MRLPLAAAFLGATDFRRKSDLAEQLGYIGSDACAKALLSEFNSPVIGEFKYDRVSIRCPIVLALGRIYPDEPLLTSEIRQMLSVGEDDYGDEKVNSYLADVAAWAGQTLKTPVTVAPLPVLYERVIYIFPLNDEGGGERPLRLDEE